MLPTTLTRAASAVTGHREGGNEEKGVAARGGGDQSFFLSSLCFWTLNLSFCVLFLLCFSVFVFPRGPPASPDLCEENPSSLCQTRMPALLEILSNSGQQARPAILATPAIPTVPVLVLPGGAMGGGWQVAAPHPFC